jgi:hypothetical protein
MKKSVSFYAVRRFALGVAALAALAPATARAQNIVAPNAFANVQAGGTANSAPFNNQSRYQQIFAANQFSALTGPAVITQITFRPTANQTAFSRNIPNIQFNLSTTSQTVAGLSSTFASNVGANDTVVRSGSVTFSSASAPGNPKAFDIVVNLTTPFFYNPAAGNLLLDIRTQSVGGGASFFVDLGTDSSTRLVFADANPNTATTGTVQNAGIVTRFTFVIAPEPGVLALLLPSLGLVGLRRRLR